MNNIQVDLMLESDLDSVTQIFLDVFNKFGENWSLETAGKHIKENFFGDCHYVVRIEGRIVGFVMAIPLTREKGTELFIDSIAVLPEIQRKGIGKLLWDKVNKYAK
ncbi:MAG TPA: GNAT family N-acetyltransferase, partial [Candidatus Nitrosocosmicus sp.]|nr:GNAT family N-acetyltransferase [Candidatus Nitrosocosmicus sp.]